MPNDALIAENLPAGITIHDLQNLKETGSPDKNWWELSATPDKHTSTDRGDSMSTPEQQPNDTVRLPLLPGLMEGIIFDSKIRENDTTQTAILFFESGREALQISNGPMITFKDHNLKFTSDLELMRTHNLRILGWSRDRADTEMRARLRSAMMDPGQPHF